MIERDAVEARLRELIAAAESAGDHREQLARGLEALGHSVAKASDGLSAEVALHAEALDVLLLDFAMPA